MNVRLTPALKVKILNADDIYKVMQQVLLRENKIRRNQEHFWVVGLNNSNKILFVELVSLGASNRVEVAPPEVFRLAIYKLSGKVILVHNHPSGNLNVSANDKAFTARMMKAGELININVLDHLVITETDYMSFGDEGIMNELYHHEKFALAEREKRMLNELVKDARTQLNVEIAKRLKVKGMTVEFISEVTGLPKGDVKKL